MASRSYKVAPLKSISGYWAQEPYRGPTPKDAPMDGKRRSTARKASCPMCGSSSKGKKA